MSDETENNVGAVETELDVLRKDIVHQVHMGDDLDLDYLLEVTLRAKFAADKEGRNMVECVRTLDEIIRDAKAA